MSPVGAIFVQSPPETGTNLLHPHPPQSLNGSCGDTGGHIARNCPQRKDKVGYIGKRGNALTLIAESVHTTAMPAIPDVAATKSAPERFESWNADSGSTNHMTPDATVLT